MAGKYSLTLQLQLQSPANVAQVVSQLQKQLGNVSVNVQVKNAAQATSQMQQLTTATNNASNAAAKLGDAFGVSLKRFAAFSLASRAIGVFTRNLAGAVDASIAFQDGLVKISQITGQNIEDLGGLTKEVTRLATTLGVASDEILGVTNILAQAGLKANDLTVAINTLTKTKLAPTFGDINDTAEGAVALIAQFGEGVGALERQLGSINRVAAEFAVESEDLIEVVRRTGGVFKASGGDLNELLALFTSVRATTRESAESIATALKTIFTRIQRPETIAYLQQLGVELTDINGKFVGPFEAVRKLSSALQGLGEGDIRFISIAEELGGYRQIGKVIPLIRQFETAERARQVALDAGNSLNEDAVKAQQSLAVQFTKTREKFLAFIRGISETSSFQILVKTTLNLANALLSVADALKPIIPLITAFAAVKFASNIGSFAGAIGGAFTRRQFGGPIQKFARGGFVPGVGNGDTVPAMLTPGEFVIRKSSVKKLGAGTLAAMNENRFNKGGQASRVRQSVALERDEKKSEFKFATIGSDSGDKRSERGRLFIEGKDDRIFNELKDKKTAEYGAAFLSPENKVTNLQGYLDLDKIIKKDRKLKNKKLKDYGKIPIKFYAASLDKEVSESVEDKIFKGILFSVRSGAKLLSSQYLANAPIKSSDQDLTKILRQSNIDNIIGNVYEAVLSTTGAPFSPDKESSNKPPRKANATFDFPNGIGELARTAFGNTKLEKGIKVDAKTRFTTDNIRSLLKKAESDQAAQILDNLNEAKKSSRMPSVAASKIGTSEQKITITEEQKQLLKKSLNKNGGIGSRKAESIFGGFSNTNLAMGELGYFKNGNTYVKKAFGGMIQRFASGGKPFKPKRYQLAKGVSPTANLYDKMSEEQIVADYVLQGSDKLNSVFNKNPVRSLNPKQTKSIVGKLSSAAKDELPPTLFHGFSGGAWKQISKQLGLDNSQDTFSKIVGSLSAKIPQDPELARSLIGKSFLLPGFLSTSVSDRAAAKFMAAGTGGLLTILTNQAKKGINVSKYAGSSAVQQRQGASSNISKLINEEQEYILTKGNRFSVKGISSTRLTGDTKPNFAVQQFAKGGAASDTVPALLTPGEFVINKGAAQRIGYGNLNRMNKRGVAGFAKGGPVAVQKFNTGTTGRGVASTSTSGDGGFNLLSDKASQLALGFSLLSGTLGGTETAFQKTVSSITSFGTTVSSIVALMNAFGASKFFDLQKIDIKKIFGTGKGGLGDVLFGSRKLKESFIPGRIARGLRRSETFSGQFRSFSSPGGRAFGRQSTTFLGKAGQILGERAAAGGITGKIAGLAGRGIAAVGGASAGGAVTALASLAGPATAIAGGFALLNSVVGNLVDAETKYQAAVEKGSLIEAEKYAVLKESNAIIGLFGQGAAEAYLDFTSAFTGKTADSVKAQADAAVKAARFTNEFAENEKKASKVLADAERGTISFSKALDDASTTANLRNASQAEAATIRSIKETDKSGRSEGLGAFARNIFTIGGLLGETSSQYNAKLDKQNNDALQESVKRTREEFDKLAPAIAKANTEGFIAGKTNEEILKERMEQLGQTPLTTIEKGRYEALQERKTAINSLTTFSDPRFRGKLSLSTDERKGIFRNKEQIQADTTLTDQQKEAENLRRSIFELTKKSISKTEFRPTRPGGTILEEVKLSEEEITRRAATAYSNIGLKEDPEQFLKDLSRKAFIEAGGDPNKFDQQKLTPEEERFVKAAEARYSQELELLKNIENQRKAYEENQKYLKSLNYGLAEVSARARSASVALENYVSQSETGSIKTQASLATLQTALSSAGSSVKKADFESAQTDIANVLKSFGANSGQIDTFQTKSDVLFKGRQNLGGVLEEIRSGLDTSDSEKRIRDVNPTSIKTEIENRLIKSLGLEKGSAIEKEIRNSFGKLELTEEIVAQIKAGNLEQVSEQLLADLQKSFIDQISPIIEEYNKQQQQLVDLTRQRIELEKSLAESTKRSIDIELESRKAIEEFGGPVLKTADKLNALNRKISQDLNLAGVRGVTSGSAAEISRTQAEVQSRFRVLQSQQDSALKSGKGTPFSGVEGLDQDKRQQLRDAQDSLIDYTRNRLDLIREEIELAKKKNELEKSAIDKLVSGDIEGFLKDQQASAAANVLRFGDQDLAKLFTPTALGAGLQSLQGQGLSDKEIETAYRTALMPVGGTERMAQVGAGTTPELEALKREGRDLASVLNETGRGIVEMDTMTVNAKTIQIIGAQDQLNQFRTNIPNQIEAAQRQAAQAATTATTGANVNNGTFNANAAAGAIGAGMAIGGGPLGGIAAGNINNLTDSLNKFYESANMLKDLKLTMKLDTTNVNVNFNGAGFLENLTNEVRTGVLKEVLNTIKREMKLDSEGRPTFPNI